MAGNPLRSEEAAFQWVLGTLAVAALVVAASWLDARLGLAVFAILAGVGAWRLLGALRTRRPGSPDEGPADVSDTPPDVR